MITQSDHQTQSCSPPARGNGRAEANQPQPPSLHASADELLKFVSELEHRTGRIDAYLYGEKPEQAGNKQIQIDSLEWKIQDATTRTACLCGFAATILSKLTGQLQ